MFFLSLCGPLPPHSTQRHVRKLGFLKNHVERVACQWRVPLSQIPDGITEASLSLSLSRHSNPAFLPGLLAGMQILEILFPLATVQSPSPSPRQNSSLLLEIGLHLLCPASCIFGLVSYPVCGWQCCWDQQARAQGCRKPCAKQLRRTERWESGNEGCASVSAGGPLQIPSLSL